MKRRPTKSGSSDRKTLTAEQPQIHAENPAGGMSGYEGAQYNSLRSAFWTFPTNSRHELNSFTRVELLRKFRALDANLGLINRIKQTIRRRAVGKGIMLVPSTRDTEWNVDNRKRFENWGSAPHVYSIDSSRDLWEDQAMAAEAIPGDGEFFEALVKGDGGAPMVQPLDPFEIGAGEASNYDAFPASKWEDGILANDHLRPIAYAVRELPSTNYGVAWDTPFVPVPADSMIHIFQRRRAKQLRGITGFFSGINKGIDAMDLSALIVGTAKLHSGLAVVVKKTGKMNKRGAFGKIENLAGTGNPSDADVSALERIYGGGMISYLGAEGEIDLKTSAFPQQNLMEFLKFLLFEIAAGLGLPLQVVYDMADLGGAATRATLEDAQMYFDMIQDMVFWRHTHRIYVWNTSLAVKSGQMRPCKDPLWWTCTQRGPAKLTPDNGRTAQQQVMLLNNGALSHERLFEERGQDAYDEIGAEIRFHKWLNETCKSADVEKTDIIRAVPGAMGGGMGSSSGGGGAGSSDTAPVK